MEESKQAWIRAAYECFALEGPTGLKVEALARQVGKSKSSFYHHFADLEIFTQYLLDHHLQQATLLAEKESHCQCIDPELTEVLVEHKTDLLFHRQLRIHRSLPTFDVCIEKTNQLLDKAFLEVWARDMGMDQQILLAKKVLDVLSENFYLQIRPETLTVSWLSKYFRELRGMLRQLQR